MSKQSFTPGPWVTCDSFGPEAGGTSVMANDSYMIASCCFYYGKEQTQANARLIAAAPDLLEALRAYDRWNYEVQSARVNGESVYSYDELQEMRKAADALAQAAIAKATGEQA